MVREVNVPNINACYITSANFSYFQNKHTFAASIGLSAISAKNSADAEAAR
jgi:hypothetical protein